MQFLWLLSSGRLFWYWKAYINKIHQLVQIIWFIRIFLSSNMTISLIQHKNKNDFMSMNISFPPTHRFARDLTINFIEFDDLVCIFHSILGRPQTNTTSWGWAEPSSAQAGTRLYFNFDPTWNSWVDPS